MPSFGRKSEENLLLLPLSVQRGFRIAIQYVDFKIICTARNQKDQNEAVLRGTSKINWPYGNHNCLIALPENERAAAKLKWPNLPYYAMAADIIPYPIPINMWDQKYAYRFSYIIAKLDMIFDELYRRGECEFISRNGCDWDRDGDLNDQDFNDLGHIEFILPSKNLILPNWNI